MIPRPAAGEGRTWVGPVRAGRNFHLEGPGVRTRHACFPLLAIAVALAGCDDNGPAAPADTYQEIVDEFGLAPLPAIPYPPENTFNAERMALGQLLFFDPILGGESGPWVKQQAGIAEPYRHRANDMACATCHHPAFAFADGRRLGAGTGGAQLRDTDLGPQRVVPGRSILTDDEVGLVPRNSPTVLNTAFNGMLSPEPTSGERSAEYHVLARADMVSSAPSAASRNLAFASSNLPAFRNAIPTTNERF